MWTKSFVSVALQYQSLSMPVYWSGQQKIFKQFPKWNDTASKSLCNIVDAAVF